MYIISLHNMNVTIKHLSKLVSSPFMKFLLRLFFEDGYAKLMALYKRSHRTYLFFNSMSILHERFIKQASKQAFTNSQAGLTPRPCSTKAQAKPSNHYP